MGNQDKGGPKYTADDPDVYYLDEADKTNYAYELLKHDVEQNLEPYIGAQSAQGMRAGPAQAADNIAKMMKSPRNFPIGVLCLIIFILLFIVIVYLVVFIILIVYNNMKDDKYKKQVEIMTHMFLYFILALLILALLYYLLNRITKEANALRFIAAV